MQSGLPGSIETLLPPSPVHPLALYHAQMLEKRGYTYFKFDAVKTIYLANRDCLPPPLSAATWNEAFGAINRHDLKAIIKMLDLGLIVPNSQDVLGTSLIARACRLQFLECVKLLLERGGFARLSDREGRTPLHEAAWFCGTDLRICELLILWDESLLRAADRNGSTPLEYVRTDPETVQVWQHFLETNKETMWPLYAAPGRTPEEWACSLYFTKGDVSASSRDRQTAGAGKSDATSGIGLVAKRKEEGNLLLSTSQPAKTSSSSAATRSGRPSRSSKNSDKASSEGGVVSTSGSEPTTAALFVSKGGGTSGGGGKGKGGKGPQMKKSDVSSSVDEKGVSSESLSLSGGSREGGGDEDKERRLQRKANSGGSPSDDAMLTGGSNSPPISGSGSDQFNRADSGSGERSSNGQSPTHEESLLG